MNIQHLRTVCALLLAFAAIIAVVVTLRTSHDQPVSSWFSNRSRPTVLLAVCSVVTNAMLHFVLSEALPIRWWLIARSPVQKVSAEKLSETYDQGSGLWAALRELFTFRFNRAALAYLCVGCAAISGPLLQRATRVETAKNIKMVELSARLATQAPDGFSGWGAGRGRSTVLLTAGFTKVVKEFGERQQIVMKDAGCIGVCETQVEAMGFKVDCKEGSYDYDLERIEIRANGGITPPQTTGFFTSVAMAVRDPLPNEPSTTPLSLFAYLNVSTAFKNTPAFVGKGLIRNCTLDPATVRYPIRLINSTVTLLGTMKTDEIISTYPVDSGISSLSPGYVVPQTLGGVALWAKRRYSSSALISYDPIAETELRDTTGTLMHDFTQVFQMDRSISWSDPTDSILDGIREVMFRSAIEFADEQKEPVKVGAKRTADVLIYKTSTLFMALGVAAALVGCIGVLPLLWGFWALEKDVNLNPSQCAEAVLAIVENRNVVEEIHEEGKTVAYTPIGYR